MVVVVQVGLMWMLAIAQIGVLVLAKQEQGIVLGQVSLAPLELESTQRAMPRPTVVAQSCFVALPVFAALRGLWLGG